MTKMNIQEVFEKSVTGVLAQKGKSVRRGECRLRHKNLKCAVGHLIPDEQYSLDMEYDSCINQYLETYDPVKSFKRTQLGICLSSVIKLSTKTMHLLDTLQSVHDCCSPNEYYTELKQIGENFKLDTSFMEKLK